MFPSPSSADNNGGDQPDRNVYERVWRDEDPNAMVYEQFHTILFKDIRQNDRIARCYGIDQELVDI